MSRNSGASDAKKIIAFFLTLLSALSLTACGGGSSSHQSSSPAVEDSRTLETGNPAPPAPGDAISTEIEDPDASTPMVQSRYKRDFSYPEMVTLPLQFLTTTSGKKLGVKVTLPANERGVPAPGPFPTLLVQTAYNMNLVSLIPMSGSLVLGAPDPFFVKHGYAIVAVDVLGSGVSEGGWEMLGAAEQAGYADTVDWVQQQPWFNGKLGAAGVSYMAITALFSAESRPDAFQAIFAGVPMGDAQRGTVGTGGMLNGVFMSTWMTLTHLLSTQNIPTMLLNPKYYSQIAAATQEHIDQIDNYYLPLANDALDGASYVTYDSDFWRTRSPLENIDKIKTPTIIFGALHDIFQRDAPLLYEAIKKNTDSHLIIYNGDHLGSNLQAMIGGDQVQPMLNLMLQWFDHYLMGMDTGTDQIPAVVQYVKNHSTLFNGSFSAADDWPHPLAEPERWYLHGNMQLTQAAPFEAEATHNLSTPEFAGIEFGKSDSGGLLTTDITLNDGTKCSPSYLQWTLGSAGVLQAPSCFFNNAKLEADALNYETAAMPEDYYINGPMQADIWMESSAHEAVLSVRIDEVSGRTGTVFPITNGLLVASVRAVDESRSRFLYGEMIQPYHFLTEAEVLPVEPGQVFKMQVEIFPSSVIIRKGNKLRISLSSSNQAQGMLNYPRRDLAQGGVTTIHNSPEYPSSLVLPIVPVSALN